MIRIVRFRSLLEKIMPLLQTRIRGSIFEGWTGRIDLQYEADAASLEVQQGDLRISDTGQKSSGVLRSSQLQLMRLMAGNLSAGQIASTNNLQISQEVVDFLEVIFPADELFMWRTDTF